ncbi:hypothetical protein DOTSEDRAFT_39608 [Dothistroma septosporum NZE10]|uniref:Uncharacterized protein n=1 Tax=Dothistroma septosporum (strain NZE10 / CBS 128990) TaxID=675120 RepID=M2XG69_DOTSN|nr:hypothetical protein DOTSEDRAFT_39608 [Dothistroma septosporum NZE10]
MVPASSKKNTRAGSTTRPAKARVTNERWLYRDYMVVRVLVHEYHDNHQDFRKHHLSLIFAEVCPHKMQYPSNRLYEHRSVFKNTSVAKDKQRAWRRNEFANIESPGPDEDLVVEIKDAINATTAFKVIQDANEDSYMEECGRLEGEDAAWERGDSRRDESEQEKNKSDESDGDNGENYRSK